MATQKQEALVKFGKADNDIKITNCRKEIRGSFVVVLFCFSVVARTSKIAAIIPSTFYIAQRHYNLSQHLHQSAEVKKKCENKLSSFLSLKTPSLYADLSACPSNKFSMWETLHGNFLTCHNLQSMLIYHLL